MLFLFCRKSGIVKFRKKFQPSMSKELFIKPALFKAEAYHIHFCRIYLTCSILFIIHILRSLLCVQVVSMDFYGFSLLRQDFQDLAFVFFCSLTQVMVTVMELAGVMVNIIRHQSNLCHTLLKRLKYLIVLQEKLFSFKAGLCLLVSSSRHDICN